MLKQDEWLRWLQASIGKALAAIPLTPNQWTLLSILVALFAGAMIARGDLAFGLALFALAALLDAVDGAVARARGEVSALGGFIDGVADRFVEAIFLFSFMFYPLPAVFIDPRIWLALVVFLGTCMPSFIRAYADHKGVLAREKANALGGICERSERLALMIIGLAAGLIMGMELFIWSLMLVCALSLITIAQRLIKIQPNVKA
ncbi:MAG: CDP-alcohol phosphatidyltransferase family protein [Candidatus Micrarchaeota archaeon]